MSTRRLPHQVQVAVDFLKRHGIKALVKKIASHFELAFAVGQKQWRISIKSRGHVDRLAKAALAKIRSMLLASQSVAIA